jgi:hypothetical protein
MHFIFQNVLSVFMLCNVLSKYTRKIQGGLYVFTLRPQLAPTPGHCYLWPVSYPRDPWLGGIFAKSSAFLSFKPQEYSNNQGVSWHLVMGIFYGMGLMASGDSLFAAL